MQGHITRCAAPLRMSKGCTAPYLDSAYFCFCIKVYTLAGAFSVTFKLYKEGE